MFVKLYGSILDSSIWSADLATRVVWITMLAMADENGIVYASAGGLARRAHVSDRECRKALKILQSPDKDDRSGVEGGVRIRPLQGAWELINYMKYRELRTKKQIVDAARQARHRQQHAVTPRDGAVTGVTGHKRHSDITASRTEVEVEAEVETTKPSAPTAARATWLTPFSDAWQNTYGGEPAYGELAKAIRPLLDRHPVGEVLDHWVRYMGSVEGQYAKPGRFAQTYGEWAKPERGKEPLPDMYLTLEEQEQRRAKSQGAKAGPEHIGDILQRGAV